MYSMNSNVCFYEVAAHPCQYIFSPPLVHLILFLCSLLLLCLHFQAVVGPQCLVRFLSLCEILVGAYHLKENLFDLIPTSTLRKIWQQVAEVCLKAIVLEGKTWCLLSVTPTVCCNNSRRRHPVYLQYIPLALTYASVRQAQWTLNTLVWHLTL